MTGEMSMPPRLGSMLRMGRSAGSVIWYRNVAIVATTLLRVFTTLNAMSQDKIAATIKIQIPPGAAEYEFAWRYATGWLSALKRLSPPARRPDGILVFDGSGPLDADALHVDEDEVTDASEHVRTIVEAIAADI